MKKSEASRRFEGKFSFFQTQVFWKEIRDIIMNITILGSTGSIGTQTLDIIRDNPHMKAVVLTAHRNVELMEAQVREFAPELVCMTDEKAASDLKTKIADTAVKVVSGAEGLKYAAAYGSSEIVVTAVVGISGLLPTIEAIKSGKNIALANKETMVCAGHIITALAKEKGIKILPVDSEHSAIFQSLQGTPHRAEKIILTASGGPFFGKTRAELQSITPAQALKHPNWDMGAKVTIDSATLVNKGLEVMEAHWLFDTDYDSIEVLVHRQSVIHSMVEYADGGIIAQLGVPDMHLPIQYALTYPNRLPINQEKLDFGKYPSLTFAKPDTETFPALRLAFEAGKKGGILPTVFNSADEMAVELFLKEKIGFLQIADCLEKAMAAVPAIANPTIDDILEADKFARSFAEKGL